MQALKNLEVAVLIDMLSTHTADHTRMLSEGASDIDFAKCKLTIRALQTEIDSRKNSVENTSVSDPGITTPPEYST